MARFWLKVGSCTLGKNGYGLGMDELPPSTLRLLFNDGYTPTFSRGTATQLSVSPNVWDFNFLGQDTYYILKDSYSNPNGYNLKAVVAGNTSGLSSVRGLLAGMEELEYVCPLDLSSVTDMSEFLFGSISGDLFYGPAVDLPSFDTHNVTNMSYAFYGCERVTSFGKLDTTNVTDMGGAFSRCGNILQPPEGLDTSSVVTAVGARRVDRGGEIYSEYRGLFSHCYRMTSIPALDLRATTDISHMFEDCFALRSIPAIRAENIEAMESTFNSSGIVSLPMIDTGNVRNMYGTFYGCRSLENLPTLDTHNVENMDGMLCYCESLKSIPLFNTDKVTTMSTMCEGCTKVESGALALYQQASTQATPPRNHVMTFYNCGSDTVTGAAELAEIPSDWK